MQVWFNLTDAMKANKQAQFITYMEVPTLTFLYALELYWMNRLIT